MAGGIKTIITIATALLFSVVLSSGGSATNPPHVRTARRPCKTMVVYYHDTLFNGANFANATSVIVGAPAWANKTRLAVPNSYADVVVFDGPLTADADRRSPPVGRAQGLYAYVDRDETRAWHGFSMFFNSSEHRGILNFSGLNVVENKTRDISVVGGTGDFFLHRGIATVSTDDIEVTDYVYYRLRMEVKLYECWSLVS